QQSGGPLLSDLSPAIRVFERGKAFSYGVTIYNAPLDANSQQPPLELQPRLMRGDQVVWEGRRFPVILAAGTDPTRIPAGGVLTLGPKTAPGDYTLSVQLIDRASKREFLDQSIDFELR
ncbi:MAG: hypothetical protein ABI972_21340, partial [Acidobacteriota bacterium]